MDWVLLIFYANFIDELGVGLKIKIGLFLILITLILSRDFIYNIFTSLISRTSESLLQGDSYIRYYQVSTGISLFLKNPILGIDNNIDVYGIKDLVFENSYVDLLVKTGILPITLILTSLIFIIKNSNSKKFFITTKVIFSLLILSFFNETISEEIFWIPIFFSYGLENKIYFENYLDRNF